MPVPTELDPSPRSVKTVQKQISGSLPRW